VSSGDGVHKSTDGGATSARSFVDLFYSLA
jgi:hypothetical protein